MEELHFEIVTPERIVYQDSVDAVTIPTRSGEISILPNHIPLVSIVKTGILRVIKKNQEVEMAISSGFLEMRLGNRLTILADSAERSEEIDITRAEEARTRAEAFLKEKRFADTVEFAAYAAALERSLTRIKIAKKKKAR